MKNPFILPDLFGFIGGVIILGMFELILTSWIFIWILIVGSMILIRNIIEIKSETMEKKNERRKD